MEKRRSIGQLKLSFFKKMDIPMKKHNELEIKEVNWSSTWRSGLERRFYDDHDRKVDGSTPNLVSLLRPWIRCFTMIISTWWNPASGKLKKSEAKFNRKTRKQRQLLNESGFVLGIAPPPLPRDRRIKIKKSIKKLIKIFFKCVCVPKNKNGIPRRI